LIEQLQLVIAKMKREQRVRPAAPPDGHQKSIRYQLCRHGRTHRPAHHAAREQIDHRCHIEPALGRPEVGEVGDPLLVRTLGGELPVQQVRRHGLELPIAAVLGQAPASQPCPQALQAHQLLDPVQAAVRPVGEQITPDPGAP
jgi:hypothetical protein